MAKGWCRPPVSFPWKLRGTGLCQALVHQILQGKVNAVINALHRKGARAKLRGKRGKRLAGICGYFKTHSHRMAYDEHLTAGIFVP
jgi:hypothetical protein